MKLKLIGYRVVSLNLEAVDREPSIEQRSDELDDLQVGQFFPDDKDNIFGVGFKIAFQREEYVLNAEMRFFFETDELMTEEFKNGLFPIINAPAIAFPYLRSFLSVVTMQAGYPVVMLPSVNFVEFAKRVGKQI